MQIWRKSNEKNQVELTPRVLFTVPDEIGLHLFGGMGAWVAGTGIIPMVHGAVPVGIATMCIGAAMFVAGGIGLFCPGLEVHSGNVPVKKTAEEQSFSPRRAAKYDFAKDPPGKYTEMDKKSDTKQLEMAR